MPLVTGFRCRAVVVLMSVCAVASIAVGLHLAGNTLASAQAPTPQERTEFSKAQTLFVTDKTSEARIALEKFLQAFPSSELRWEAATMLGHLRIQDKAYRQAVTLLSGVLETATGAEYEGRARLDLALAYIGLGEERQAKHELTLLVGSRVTPGLKREAYEQLSALAVKSRDLAGAVSWLMEEYALPEDVVDAESVGTRIRELVSNAEDPGALEAIVEAHPGVFPSDLALTRAAFLYGSRGDAFNQDRVLEAFLRAFPTHELSVAVRQTLDENRARANEAEFVIALPLPYQGELKPYAESILRGAQLALEVARSESGGAKAVLVARDYRGDLRRLGEVLDETCGRTRCIGIVGPILSREGEVIAKRALSWQIPAVSPTATGWIPRNRYVFRTSITPTAEGQASARYAIEHLGLRRFAVLAAEDRYSADVAAAFTAEITRQGGRIVFSGTYESGNVDFGREIKTLRAADLKQEGAIVQLPAEGDQADAGADARTPDPVYVPGFDAVFLPGEAKTVGLVASQLRFYEIEVPILGSSGWNDRTVIKSGGRYVEDAVFPDGFFSQSSDTGVQRFVKQFQSLYREVPDVFAASAYDATLLLLDGLRNGASDGEQLREELIRIAGQSGVSGIMGFGPDGEALRRFSWIQIRDGQFVPAL